MKLGLSIKIDVKKIDKARLYEGSKGTYLDLTTFIDLEDPSQYGDHGFISQSVTKEERESGVKGDILGNVKVFFTGESDSGGQDQQQSSAPTQSQTSTGGSTDFDDDIPF